MFEDRAYSYDEFVDLLDVKSIAGVELVEDKDADVKLVLPWTITEEFLQDNPDGDKVMDTVFEMMAYQAKGDMRDLIVRGDTDSDHSLHRAMDGLKKKKLQPKDAVLGVAPSEYLYKGSQERPRTPSPANPSETGVEHKFELVLKVRLKEKVRV